MDILKHKLCFKKSLYKIIINIRKKWFQNLKWDYRL